MTTPARIAALEQLFEHVEKAVANPPEIASLWFRDTTPDLVQAVKDAVKSPQQAARDADERDLCRVNTELEGIESSRRFLDARERSAIDRKRSLERRLRGLAGATAELELQRGT